MKILAANIILQNNKKIQEITSVVNEQKEATQEINLSINHISNIIGLWG